jgi:hypothetical protein
LRMQQVRRKEEKPGCRKQPGSMKRAGRMRRGLAMDRTGFPVARLVKHRFDHCLI